MKKIKINNSMSLTVPAKSENESLVRSVVAAFASQADPTLDEINDIKTAVSEAVTNCVVHAYKRSQNINDIIKVECQLTDGELAVVVADNGVGITDIDKAMQPFFTTAADGERSGMGFTVMQSFMDSLYVNNQVGGGTAVTMKKFFTKEENLANGA
jgi:stage II sporulation protein AB (anti-sigma F factor)